MCHKATGERGRQEAGIKTIAAYAHAAAARESGIHAVGHSSLWGAHGFAPLFAGVKELRRTWYTVSQTLVHVGLVTVFTGSFYWNVLLASAEWQLPNSPIEI